MESARVAAIRVFADLPDEELAAIAVRVRHAADDFDEQRIEQAEWLLSEIGDANIRRHAVRSRGAQGRLRLAAVGAGAIDVTANICYVAATRTGKFGLAVVLAALYPAVTVLLASGEASYMTGAEIVLDGGLLAGSAASPARARRRGRCR